MGSKLYMVGRQSAGGVLHLAAVRNFLQPGRRIQTEDPS